MRFDTIILGGGLSGLAAGIRLQEGGQKTALVSGGQSALHFWSGSFRLLDVEPGRDPVEESRRLPAEHPYRIIGADRLRKYAYDFKKMLGEAGLHANGRPDANHWHITPVGMFCQAWLTGDDYYTFDTADGPLPWKRVAIVNVAGYIDFYPRFIERAFHSRGCDCRLSSVDTPALDFVRQSCTEMRATNMARVFDAEAIADLAKQVDKASKGCDVVFMPAIFGMFDEAPMRDFRASLDIPVYFVPTTPASVPGTRMQLRLKARYEELGGRFLAGDLADGGKVEDGRLRYLTTRNFQEMPLRADNFVWAVGSFFGHGLVADINHIYDPILGLDLSLDCDRTGWYRKDRYESQPYMSAGVVADGRFRPSLGGRLLENVYAAGAVLSGFNALKEGSGAGITVATAFSAADNILNR